MKDSILRTKLGLSAYCDPQYAYQTDCRLGGKLVLQGIRR
jgi:hypothetical protein